MAFELIAAVSAACLFAGMLLLSEVGRRLAAARRASDPDGLAKGAGAAEAGVFGLLGLLIAFTFSGAAGRFEDRRYLISDEANAIGTAYLRVDLLPGDTQPAIRDLFRKYADIRATAYRNAADPHATVRALSDGAALQGQIWAKARAACQRPDAPPQATILLLPALNAMIDITTTRETATRTHPPSAVFALLAALCLVGAMLVGYGTAPDRYRSWFHPAIFAAVLSVTVYVILDVEFPRLGLIRVDTADRLILDVRQSMQ